jgi:DNA-binding LacI/PurR family transcriptional regulator
MASSKRTTLSDIARRADTSTMAVSVVLNGARSNTRVSDATRRRITEIASDLNYSPNAMAQGLKRQRTKTLGVLFSWAGAQAVHSLYSAAILDGIVDAAGAAGYHVLLFTQSWQTAAKSARSFSDRRTDGIVVVAPVETPMWSPDWSRSGCR